MFCVIVRLFHFVNMRTLTYLSHLLFVLGFFDLVRGRGHLIDPPMRSSLWRYYPWSQLAIPKNVDDTGLNCGGFWRLHEINNGKCGVCGDSYDQKRHNEAGGRYANGHIVRTYYQDDEFMNVSVAILSNIRGYFEFYLCPNDNISRPITQECLDTYPLTIEGYGRRYFPEPESAVKHDLFLKIPDGITCTQCVLQWKWVGGNNWGTCPDGYGGIGCGKQEEYYNCADVAILPPSGNGTRSSRVRPINRKPLYTTTTQNPMIPILPPFIRRSEKFKKFYKKYLENVMNGMVAGKWSDNAISSLDYKLENQKRINQSQQRTLWVPRRTSDFRLTGEYPDFSRPSLSINMSVPVNQKSEYSFLDIVRNSLKFGNMDSNFKSLQQSMFITGRPVYLPEGAVNVPPPAASISTPLPLSHSTGYLTTLKPPSDVSVSIRNVVSENAVGPFVYNPWGTTTMTSTPIQNPNRTPQPLKDTPTKSTTSVTSTGSTTKTTNSESNTILFPDFDYDQIRSNKIIAQRIPYYLHRSALQTPTNPVTSFFNSILNIFSPASVDYMAEVPYNYDSPITDVVYPNYPTNTDISMADLQTKFSNKNQNIQNNFLNSKTRDFVNTKSEGLLSVNAPKTNSFISRGLSSGIGVRQASGGRVFPEVKQVRNQPDILTRQLSNSEGNPGTGVRDSTVNRLRFSGNMFL